ncbi:uncharacterized protein TNCV_1424161 [Trichonephila clavipes]|nr:uncharacterized protein TNCV_1424161 [Trichonephila clavipes]
MNKIRKTPVRLDSPMILSEEFLAVDDDNECTTPMMADKDILEFDQSSKYVIDADSDDGNKASVSTSSERLENTYVLAFSSFKKRLPVRLINTTNERRLVQRHETPLRVKGEIEDDYSELDNGAPAKVCVKYGLSELFNKVTGISRIGYRIQIVRFKISQSSKSSRVPFSSSKAFKKVVWRKPCPALQRAFSTNGKARQWWSHGVASNDVGKLEYIQGDQN